MSRREAAQLPLLPTDGVDDQAFMDLLRDVVEDNGGVKVVAGELDVQPSQLSNALAGRNYNHVWAEHVPWLVRHDRSLAALRYLADLCGMDLVPQRKQTAEEELAALHDALAEQHGPEMLALVHAKARRRR